MCMYYAGCFWTVFYLLVTSRQTFVEIRIRIDSSLSLVSYIQVGAFEWT